MTLMEKIGGMEEYKKIRAAVSVDPEIYREVSSKIDALLNKINTCNMSKAYCEFCEDKRRCGVNG